MFHDKAPALHERKDPKPEIGSEAWVKAQIAAKLNPEEHDRPA